MIPIQTAVFDEDVRASVEAACVVATFDPESPLSGAPTIWRPANSLDYVAAINEHLDKFDGLDKKDITVDAVAAVLADADA